MVLHLIGIASVGVVLGSFITMVIYRLPLQKKWTGRSRCIQCRHVLDWVSLIPVFGYLLRMGRCHYCRSGIPVRYLLVELFLGCLLVFFWLQFGFGLLFFKASIFSMVLMALFWIDVDHAILPHVLTLPLIAVGPLWHLMDGHLGWHLLAGMLGFVSLWVLNAIGKWWYKRDVLGGGDMLLAAGMGTWWGIPTLGVTLYLGFLIGGIAGISLLFMRKKETQEEMPFGPALILGWLFAFSYGDVLIGFFRGHL